VPSDALLGPLYLTGFVASGKTTVGRLLAARLGVPFFDLDERVAVAAGLTVPQIFSRLGEPAFRRLEREALAALPVDGPAVVALGAGAVPPGDACVVCLRATIDETLRRLAWGPVRPLLAGPDDVRDRVEHLLSAREERYARAALTIETTGRTPEEVATQIETWLRST
jgi:shikimate kinase